MSIVNLNAARAEFEDDNTCMTPVDALEAEAEHLKSAEYINYNKALLIFIDDKDGAYSSGFRMANMSCSEALSALEIIKVQMMREMGYIE